MANPDRPDPKQQKGDNSECPDPNHKCDPLPEGPKAPELPSPEQCDYECNCPGKPTPPEPPCFSRLISDQAAIEASGQRASQTKADLEQFLKDATTGKETYTREIFKDLSKRWKQQDEDIVKAIHVVVCNVPCWWCVIDCHICQEFYTIRAIEKQLYGTPDVYMSDVHSLPDLEYWHTRRRDSKQRRYNRIKAVMEAWKNPAKSIDDALKANQAIIDNVRSMDPLDSIPEVLIKLVLRHLAIAPRPLQTGIKEKYRNLCTKCDEEDPDDCCGPDVGLPTARQRLIDPQAYIVDPDHYFDLLCCIATERLEPAKNQLEQAQKELDAVSAQIKLLQTDLDDRNKDPLAKYRGNVSAPIDCDNYTKKNGGGDCGCDDDDERSDDDESAA